MFRIGELSELDDNSHSISTSSSMGLFNTYSEAAMSRIQEKDEIDYIQEDSVFGSFDLDDPDFSSSYSGNNNGITLNSNLTCGASSRIFNQQSCGLAGRPSSRQSLGRNNSSNSLKRTKSTNSMCGSRFFIGINIEHFLIYYNKLKLIDNLNNKISFITFFHIFIITRH